MRFSCVSQSWKSTISDSQFIKLHLHRSTSRRNTDFAHIRLLISSPSESRLATAANSSYPSGYSFCGTCNGLTCLRTLLEYDRERRQYFYRVCLWNSAMRSMSQHSQPLYFTSTTCDFGFGYDSSIDTYKVVAVTRSSDWERTVNVYNMGDACWRRTQVSPLPCIGHIGDAVYVSNTLNWLAALPFDVIINGNDGTELMKSDPYMIFSFDLGKENCAQLSLPYCPRSRYEFYGFEPILGVLRGCLCVCQTYKMIHFAIWQMKEFGVHQSWTLLFNIARDVNIVHWPCFAMYMSENDEALLLSRASQVGLYIQKDNKLEVMSIAHDIIDCYANNYIESLVSPY